jgi:hypothetical protein
VIAPVAHVAGIPIEETVAGFGPFLLAVSGAAIANMRAGRQERRNRADDDGVTGHRHGQVSVKAGDVHGSHPYG